VKDPLVSEDTNESTAVKGKDTRWQEQTRRKKKLWTNREKSTLKKAISELGTNWKEIAKRLPGRSGKCVKNFSYRQGYFRWTSEEVAILRSAIEEWGDDWEEIIGKKLPRRRRRDARLFALQHGLIGTNTRKSALKPAVYQNNYRRWTDKEKAAFAAAVHEFGNDWVLVAKRVPGRSMAAIGHYAKRSGYHGRSAPKSSFTDKDLKQTELTLDALDGGRKVSIERLSGRTKDSAEDFAEGQPHLEASKKRSHSAYAYPTGPSPKRMKGPPQKCDEPRGGLLHYEDARGNLTFEI